jgi:hypothetical protein
MSAHVPALLMLTGTALTAIAIFAPREPARPANVSPLLAPPELPPGWPERIDPGAAGCDCATRIELAEALGAVASPWAAAVLRQALDEEPDVAVRVAIAAGLARSSNQSLVT